MKQADIEKLVRDNCVTARGGLYVLRLTEIKRICEDYCVKKGLQQEPELVVYDNGCQLSLVNGSGGYFDMSKYRGAKFYTTPIFLSQDAIAGELIDIRNSLQFASDSPDGGITGTVRMMHSPETVLEALDKVIDLIKTQPT